MFTFSDEAGGHSRRSFLKVGSMGLGGWALPGLLSAQAAGSPFKDKSVVFVFMHGGPAQTETFDPKMDAPMEVRSATGEVKTTLPGITFGGTFTKLAREAHRMAVIRSFVTGDGIHDIKPIVGKDSLKANIGSIYSKIAGATQRDTGMPTNVALYPQAIDPAAQAVPTNFGNFNSTGGLGASFAPFEPGAGGSLQQDMELRLDRRRLDDRRSLLRQLDDMKRAMDATSGRGFSQFQQQAFDTLVGGIADAFDLSKEDPRTIARYDTAPLVSPDSIRKVWANHHNYRDHGQSLGKLMLMARRLCERGSRFVTVTTNFVWDMHADLNNATMTEGMGYVGAPFDHAVAAFIQDVHERGLQDKILLVCCGEMGRSPRINAKGGRDHWGKLAPLMLSGGGLPMGQVIGSSTRDAGEPESDPVTMQNLIGTIMHTLFDVGEVRLMPDLQRNISQIVTQYQPIRQLF
ncbi:MAG: hypothetical protein ACI9R3_002745 [Verrucomicrobiales bacterium]|jgi:hypothetical protein